MEREREQSYTTGFPESAWLLKPNGETLDNSVNYKTENWTSLQGREVSTLGCITGSPKWGGCTEILHKAVLLSDWHIYGEMQSAGLLCCLVGMIHTHSESQDENVNAV